MLSDLFLFIDYNVPRALCLEHGPLDLVQVVNNEVDLLKQDPLAIRGEPTQFLGLGGCNQVLDQAVPIKGIQL